MANEKEKELAAKEAVKLIKNNQIVGLGTGSTVLFAIKAIGEMVKNGLEIKGVVTSGTTERLAGSLNIPLVDVSEVDSIDITIDGADEFSPDLSLIKGGGGALLKEKVVASLSKQEIIIADSSKQVEKLGKFKVPIEVIPYASNYVLTTIKKLNGKGKIRMDQGNIHVTEEGNYIIDGDFGLINDPALLAEQLNGIAGMVGHGLFINLTTRVIMGVGNEVKIFEHH